jgi:DNA-directed RNA polymerase beta subunit
LRLATYAKVNEFGMIETPYAKVKNGKVSAEVVYLNALEEERYNIAHAATRYDKDGKILTKGNSGFVKYNDKIFESYATAVQMNMKCSEEPFPTI